MNQTPPLAELACWVRHFLQAEIRLDGSLMDQLEATFGSTDLATVLADSGNSEAASFLELLFFPDRAVRLAYEQRWGQCTFSDRDREAILQILVDAPVMAVIHPMGGAAPLKLQVPDFAISAFVHRLNLTWQPAGALGRTLQRSVSAEKLPTIRSRLRHLRLDWHPARIELLEHFLTRFPLDDAEFNRYFGFLTALMAEMGAGEAPFDFLLARKFACFQALCKAERFERLRQASNMETLMLQGARAAHGSIAEWREQMRRIDRICESLYGRTEFFREPLEQRLEGPGQTGEQQLTDLVRWFG